MGKIRRNEAGFSPIEVILVLVVVALIGVVGFMVYKNHNKKATTNSVAATTTTKPSTTRQAKTTTQTPDPYAGWASCADSVEGSSFKYPSTWTLTGATAGTCTVGNGGELTILSPKTVAAPYFFRFHYFPANGSSSDSGAYDGDTGTETILSATALNVHDSKAPLYVVSFNAPGSSSSNDVFSFVLTDQNYTVGQKVDKVAGVKSQKTGGYYRFSANLITSSTQQYLGEYTLAQYQTQSDYANMLKVFQSLSY